MSICLRPYSCAACRSPVKATRLAGTGDAKRKRAADETALPARKIKAAQNVAKKKQPARKKGEKLFPRHPPNISTCYSACIRRCRCTVSELLACKCCGAVAVPGPHAGPRTAQMHCMTPAKANRERLWPGSFAKPAALVVQSVQPPATSIECLRRFAPLERTLIAELKVYSR